MLLKLSFFWLGKWGKKQGECSSEWQSVVSGPSIAGGELFERLVDDNFEHTEPTSARYMQQILEGMRYVHKQNIVHLDLKPENIVCVDTTGTKIKIIDFGLASKLGEFNGLCANETLLSSAPLGGSGFVLLLNM